MSHKTSQTAIARSFSNVCCPILFRCDDGNTEVSLVNMAWFLPPDQLKNKLFSKDSKANDIYFYLK